jgi:phage tail-like protein
MALTGAARPVNVRYKFTIEIDDFTSFAFNKMGELSFEVAQIDYFEGGAITPIKIPGRVTVSDVELSRGAGLDQEMWNWAKQVVDLLKGGGLVQDDYKRNFDLVQRDRTGAEVYRWACKGAWPKKFVAGEWDNDSDEPTIQMLTLAIDTFELVQ